MDWSRQKSEGGIPLLTPIVNNKFSIGFNKKPNKAHQSGKQKERMTALLNRKFRASDRGPAWFRVNAVIDPAAASLRFGGRQSGGIQKVEMIDHRGGQSERSGICSLWTRSTHRYYL
jgi:hypothetical protein